MAILLDDQGWKALRWYKVDYDDPKALCNRRKKKIVITPMKKLIEYLPG